MFRFYPLKKGLVVGELGGENFSIGKFRLYSIVQLKPLKFYPISNGRGNFLTDIFILFNIVKKFSPQVYTMFILSQFGSEFIPWFLFSH